jgi:hypothetical protein
MKPTDRLYNLLPYVYRARDEERKFPLRAFLRLVEEQVELFEADIGQLYDDWFIETCRDWVVPYLGELVGFDQVAGAGRPGDVATFLGQLQNRALFPRKEVGNQVALARRKGALSVLELLANDAAGFYARAVEFRSLLGWTQHMRHVRLSRGGTVDLRDGDALDRLGGPFDSIAHTVDVRRIVSRYDRGRYNIPSVGLFVFRLTAYSVTQCPAYCVETAGLGGATAFTFDVLGHDAPLFTKPLREKSRATIAGEAELPTPIRRRALRRDLAAARRGAGSKYYGPARSFAVWRMVAPEPGKPADPCRLELVPIEHIVAADLSTFGKCPAKPGKVAVDPHLGRLALHPDDVSAGLRVSYHYGFSAAVGAGEFDRIVPLPDGAKIYRVGCFQDHLSIGDALAKRAKDVIEARTLGCPPPPTVIEITDSDVYTERVDVELGEGEILHIVASNGRRPTLRLLDYAPNAPDTFRVRGAKDSRFTLDGVQVAGRGVRVEGPLERVVFRHVTLVPGWGGMQERHRPGHSATSLSFVDVTGHVLIDASIVGPVRVTEHGEPMRIDIHDSIVDALSPEGSALSAHAGRFAHAALTILRSTIFGTIAVHQLVLGEDSIFSGKITVARTQSGCVRYSWVRLGSRTPRRYRCQPDLAMTLATEACCDGAMQHVSGDDADELRKLAELRVRPMWTSTTFGQPGYAQLHGRCPAEIAAGASDSSEMGAFHNLFTPQRMAILQARADAFTPAGFECGILLAT